MATPLTKPLLYMALQRLPGLGPRREARLFSYFRSAQELLNASHESWRKARLDLDTMSALADVREHGVNSQWVQDARPDYETCVNNDWHVLTLECPHYPVYLKEITLAPPLLYVWGEIDTLSAPLIAMVGSRKASRSGLAAASELSAALANNGWGVCSGLALGIDTAAHQAALNAKGKTIAVLGSGLASLYPRRNIDLAHAIAEAGCVVSEFPPNTAPLAANFPQRNRIVSGLSRALIVVEAAARSGSLISARYALEQNRELFAVPGSINNPQSAGCNELIKQGARLISHADDVQQELDPEGHLVQLSKASAGVDKAVCIAEQPKHLAIVLQAVGFEPTAFEQIMLTSGQTAAGVGAALLQLQLMGRVEQRGALYLRLR